MDGRTIGIEKTWKEENNKDTKQERRVVNTMLGALAIVKEQDLKTKTIRREALEIYCQSRIINQQVRWRNEGIGKVMGFVLCRNSASGEGWR